MGTVKNAVYKVDNGEDFDEIHFRTKASQVIGSDGQTMEEWTNFKNNGGTIGNSLTLNTTSSTLTDVIETNKNFLRFKNKTTNLLLAEQLLHCDGDSKGKMLLGNIEFPFSDVYLKDLGSVKNAINNKSNKVVSVLKPTLVNGWTNYNPSDILTVHKDDKGFVHIQGCVNSGNNSYICTLPYEYRPTKEVVISSTAVLSNGVITPVAVFIDKIDVGNIGVYGWQSGMTRIPINCVYRND